MNCTSLGINRLVTIRGGIVTKPMLFIRKKMNNMKKFKVIGLMSGTSLDGLDIAYCHFFYANQKWRFTIEVAQTVPYDNELGNQLKNAVTLSDKAHKKLDVTYGKWLGSTTKQFIDQNKLQVDFIASHGHTSHHKPDLGFTYQLGDGQALANTSGYNVVCNFRVQDVALGGQGAPLVPIGDALLFEAFDFCLNLGGIANISFQKNDKRIAYDVGLANMPLNYMMHTINKTFDNDGQVAKKGSLDLDLLVQLNSLTFFKKSYPKSLGVEWFIKEVKPLLDQSNAPFNNILHTLVHHNAQQIAKAVQAQKPLKTSKLLITGGGALNTFFVATIHNYLHNICQVVLPNKTIINYKEALIFAFLGVLKFEGIPNVLASVTGARNDSCSGFIYTPA